MKKIAGFGDFVETASHVFSDHAIKTRTKENDEHLRMGRNTTSSHPPCPKCNHRNETD